jgi:SpoVK/Ycf46/Vps4 family AAA+-type ATPase
MTPSPRVKTTTVGFYAINGKSVLRAVESLHKEWIVEVFEAIREQNPSGSDSARVG